MSIKISNFKSKNKNNAGFRQILTVSDLEDWVKLNKVEKDDEDDLRVYDADVTSGNIFIFISSHSLIKNISNQQNHSPPYLMIDATYKLTRNKYPLVTIGFMNTDRKYHLAALVIVNTENE